MRILLKSATTTKAEGSTTRLQRRYTAVNTFTIGSRISARQDTMEPASKKRKTDAAAGSKVEAKLDTVKDATVVKKMKNGDAQSGGGR